MVNLPVDILFIGHDASRTGAPIVLLHLLKWIAGHTDIRFEVLLKRGGELEKDYAAVSKVHVWHNHQDSVSFSSRLRRKLGIEKKQKNDKLFTLLKHRNYKLIYCNTVDSLNLIPLIKQVSNAPVIAHIHENQFSVNAYYSNCLNSEIVALIDHFIAVSVSTRTMLLKQFGIPETKVSLVYEFIKISDIKRTTTNSNELLLKLGGKGKFIIGGAGLASWRKGFDLFLKLAVEKSFNRIDKKFLFVWVGFVDSTTQHMFEYEKERLPALQQVVLAGPQTNPQNYYQLFDVFALTSREDPFPLVALEAAVLGKPVICFKQAGGIPEWVEENGGFCIDYADTAQMAFAINRLADDAELLQEKSTQIEASVSNYDINVSALSIMIIIRNFLKH